VVPRKEAAVRDLPGADEFQGFLERKVQGVSHVLRGPNVRWGRTPPEDGGPSVVATTRNVQVTYYAAGGDLPLYVFPEGRLKIGTLESRIKKAIRDARRVRTAGESSKAEVELPEWIRKRMIADEERDEAPALTEKQGEMLVLLLNEDESAHRDVVRIKGVYAKLARAGCKGYAPTFVRKMVAIGFAQPVEGESGAYDIFRKPYRSVPGRRSAGAPERPATPKPATSRPSPPRPTPPQNHKIESPDESIAADVVLEHLNGMDRHIRGLAAIGFDVRVANGVVHLDRRISLAGEAKPAEAMASVRKTAGLNVEAGRLRKIAQGLAAEGRDEEARRVFKRALAKQEEAAEGFRDEPLMRPFRAMMLRKAAAIALELGRKDEADALLTEALACEPNTTEADHGADRGIA
jgi:tetratricopeptide (TPR) repeat protein